MGFLGPSVLPSPQTGSRSLAVCSSPLRSLNRADLRTDSGTATVFNSHGRREGRGSKEMGRNRGQKRALEQVVVGKGVRKGRERDRERVSRASSGWREGRSEKLAERNSGK